MNTIHSKLVGITILTIPLGMVEYSPTNAMGFIGMGIFSPARPRTITRNWEDWNVITY